MKITQHGAVIISEEGIQVQGWQVEPEPTGSPEATHEQMLLETVIPWAQNRMNTAILAELNRIRKARKAASSEIYNPAERPCVQPADSENGGVKTLVS